MGQDYLRGCVDCMGSQGCGLMGQERLEWVLIGWDQLGAWPVGAEWPGVCSDWMGPAKGVVLWGCVLVGGANQGRGIVGVTACGVS